MSSDAQDVIDGSRRAFIGTCATVGTALVLGFAANRAAKGASPPAAVPNAFIRIDADGSVTLIMPYVEMGQGAYTAQAQILAEELEVDPNTVNVEAALPNEKLYASPLFGEQISGGSGSLRGAWITLRLAGAAARMMLVAAAAQQWQVRASACTATRGRVEHRATKRSVGYGELAAVAARMPVPAAPVLKHPAAYRVVGTSQPRLDTAAKIDGTAKFSIDVRPPGIRFAMVAACPVFNGTLARVDDADAMKIRGVRQVVKIDNAVAVIADNTWAAHKGLAALKISWNEGANAALSTADLVAAADAALDRQGLVATNTGNVGKAEAASHSLHQADFRMPILAHAAMEPLNCTVHVQSDRCEVWVGSQILGRAQKVAAEAAGLPLESVVVHNLFLGGGFGRRLETDYVTQAVLIGRQVDGPVKITWSREEDMQHDYYRYLNHSRVTVGLQRNGAPISWRHRVVGPNIMARWLPIYQKDGIDLDVVDDASGPYDIPNVLIEFTRNEAPAGLGTGNWRGVGPTRNVFVVESTIDELAHMAGADPVAYRRALMKKPSRTRAVLDLVAQKSGWGEPLPERSGRGIAVFPGFGSHLAMVAQVRVEPSGAVRVERIVCAADVGIAVNPDIVRAQIEGGAIFGISAALYGRITVANGRVEQGNFDSYPVVRMREAPTIEVHLIESRESPGGVGEPGTSGAIAAVANAVFAATGKRFRSLPLDPAELKQT